MILKRKKMKIKIFEIPVIIFIAFMFIGWVDPSYDKANEGNQLFSEGKYDEAISKYVDAQKESGEKPKIGFNIAAAQYKKEKYDEAVAAYETVIGNTKDLDLKVKANFNIANSLYRQGKLKEALEKYKQTIEIADHTNKSNEKGAEIEKLKEDARFNHEFVEKKIKEMEQQQKERQEQQQKEDQEKKDEKQESEQGQGENQEDQDKGEDEQQDQDGEDNEQGNQGEQDKQKEENKNQGENKNRKNDEQEKESQQEDEKPGKKEKENQEQQSNDGQQQQEGQAKTEMTEEEASRLLNALQQSEKNNKLNLEDEYGHGSVIDKDW